MEYKIGDLLVSKNDGCEGVIIEIDSGTLYLKPVTKVWWGINGDGLAPFFPSEIWYIKSSLTPLEMTLYGI